MKSFLITALFSFSIHIIAFTQSKATIGMTMARVKKIYPDMEMSASGNTTTLTRPETLYGIDGKWGYQFKNQKLIWIYFDKYIDELNDNNFRKCLSATRHLIKDYTKRYGKPDTTITGNTKFIDPYKKHHWGYDVLEARWKDKNGMKINIKFKFMGSKGEYHFIVDINYFDKKDPD